MVGNLVPGRGAPATASMILGSLLPALDGLSYSQHVRSEHFSFFFFFFFTAVPHEEVAVKTKGLSTFLRHSLSRLSF